MDNILQFKPRQVAPPPVEEGDGFAAPNAEPIAPSVMHTVGIQVVQALGFYATQGFDGGERARKALMGMGFIAQQQDFPGKGVLVPAQAISVEDTLS